MQKDGQDEGAQEDGAPNGIAGVELALVTEGKGIRGVRCRKGLCSSSTEASTLEGSL